MHVVRDHFHCLIVLSQESVESWALKACRGHKESWGPEGSRENLDQWASKENRACLGLQERTAYL